MIRKAMLSDVPALREMFDEFYTSPAVLHPVPRDYHERTLEELFSPGSRQLAYVFEKEGAPVGYALLSDKFSHEAGGIEWWLEEFYVREAHRGQNLGREFLRFLTEAQEREGIRRLRLEVEPENDRAAQLYESFGFRALPYAQMSRKGETL